MCDDGQGVAEYHRRRRVGVEPDDVRVLVVRDARERRFVAIGKPAGDGVAFPPVGTFTVGVAGRGDTGLTWRNRYSPGLIIIVFRYW